ncbi:CWC27 [[Candida] subhashii]|uniref:CWC27 n=1 Tax=[Candida] subhashii TaxID=561895 RepID=A0A8J5QGS3_9ASCO|nr:CWC27 [[Candida] subhashii]KAG7661110.1 CWC27 [[Candida] subhashii]
MSLEPSPTAKALIQTTKGSINISLFAKEFPITTRAFMSHILNHNYTNLQFSPNNGNNYIELINSVTKYDISKEYHPRIKFKRGTIVALHSQDENKNSVDGFQILLSDTPEWNGVKHGYTPFGRVVSEDWYTIRKIADVEVDENGDPLFPVSVVSGEIVIPFFDDLDMEKRQEGNPEIREDRGRVIKKAKVSLNYDEEDESGQEDEDGGFKMMSKYDVRGRGRTVATKNESPVAETGTVNESFPQVHPSTKEEKEESSGDDDHQKSSDQVGSSDDEEEQTTPKAKIKLTRDPTIDSDYDSNLDLSESESITYSSLKNHKFIIT